MTSEIDAQTRLGEIYMTSLLRTQLRLAGTVIVLLGLLVAGLPLAYTLLPQLHEVAFFGVPLAWLLLGVLVHPLLVLLGWFYVRGAERTERNFTDMVERS